MRLAAALAVLLLASPLASAGDAPSGRRLAPFVLPTPDGGRYDGGAHLGRDVVYLSFWATWCKPCKVELEALAPLYERLRGSGFVLLAVSVDGPDTVAEVPGFLAQHGYTFPVVLDSETELLARYNPKGEVPFSMLVGRDGTVHSVHGGYAPGDEVKLEAEIRALLAAPAEPRHRDGATIEGTESLRLQWLETDGDGAAEDDEVFSVQNKLSLGASVGPLRLGLRVDNTAYPGYDPEARCAGTAASKCPWRDDHRVERISLDYTWQGQRPTGDGESATKAEGGGTELAVTAGDFVESLGRGMTFSVRKVDELGLDTAVRGGRVAVERGPIRAQAFAGISNIQNVDPAILGTLDERSDRLAGGEVSASLPENVTVAVRASWLDYDELAGENTDAADWSVGASVEAARLGDIATLYLEGALLENLADRTSLVTGRTTDESAYGSAVYASLSFQAAPGLTVLLEGKDYRRFLLENPDQSLPLVYGAPPTLERNDQIVPSLANSSGGRVLVRGKVPGLPEHTELALYGNALFNRWAGTGEFDADETVDLSDDERGHSLVHLYAGFELGVQGVRVNASGGWRLEARNGTFGDAFTSDRAGGDVAFDRRLWHVEGELQVPLATAHALALNVQARVEEKALPPKIKGFEKVTAALTWSWSERLSLSLLYGLDGELATSTEERYLNLAGDLAFHATDWLDLRVFGGRNIGGLVCAGGVCRILPSFEGARFELVARF